MGKKAGFIAPPWPHLRGDSIRVLSLIRHIEKEASRTCGMHYEIYQHHALRELQDALTMLDADDAKVLAEISASRGFHLDEKSMQETNKAYRVILADIEREQL
ncbi:hypothetical protein [Scandinavium goeteborgense]|uniref:Uncharacterized protein n=1 Tax=Scandinavium goeteborgense TaxID=1851514 RepID=A0A4V6PQJ3_SCAGO|nr:hypothetical protein [Scandinavium goeteborgense]TDN48062.1 hypothetical protein EC847_12813 [Scandinavium goeteborgense]